MVRCLSRDGRIVVRRVPIRICDWPDVVDFVGPVKFTREMAASSLGGEVFALSEMEDHMTLLRDYYGPFAGVNPGLVGLADCESLFTHLNTKKMIAEEYLARHFLSIQKALRGRRLGKCVLVAGTGNPVDGLTKVRSDSVRLCAFMESAVSIRGLCDPSKARTVRGEWTMWRT